MMESRNNWKLISLLIGVAVIMFCGCKEDTLPQANPQPVIQLMGVSSKTIKQFKDSLVITISFTDGDGDIGENNPDKNDIWVKDSRLTKPDFYFLKPLTPPGSTLQVKGSIAIQLKNTFLLGTADTETTNYEVKIRDRAGNWSNTITTPAITITK